MPNFVPSISVDAVMDALIVFLTPFVGVNKVARGQVNRTPQLESPCAYLTEIGQGDIEIPHQTYSPIENLTNLNGPKRIDVQVDFYGPTSGELCSATKTAFRTIWGIDLFPSNIKPLYTDEGRQTPLTTGEEQYENRWTLTASLQYNPIITVPQEFADEAEVSTFVPVDIFENY